MFGSQQWQDRPDARLRGVVNGGHPTQPEGSAVCPGTSHWPGQTPPAPCEIGFEPIHCLAFMKVLGPGIRIYCVLFVLALVWIFFRGRLSGELFVDIRIEYLPRTMLLTLGTSCAMVALSLYCIPF